MNWMCWSGLETLDHSHLDGNVHMSGNLSSTQYDRLFSTYKHSFTKRTIRKKPFPNGICRRSQERRVQSEKELHMSRKFNAVALKSL